MLPWLNYLRNLYPNSLFSLEFYVFKDIRNTIVLLNIVPANLKYKSHLSRQYYFWSLRLRWGWSIACRRCSKHVFILDLTPDFNGLGKDNWNKRRETFTFCDLVRLKLEVWRYLSGVDAA